ncbi:hypothetical protein [Sinorhizobium fredii]|uniref:Uncharacterized protein n=1 Tax=Rhizobium fredii TaxID=380 RepID=A0A2L0H403_RHIFR|nr:hypothetical protein [Sinorhizobium fredii]AUX76221.1 hypothetical protein NXT3_CH01646 [Sinorhizobium fredii]
MSRDNEFQWWNPLGWAGLILQMLGAMFRSILEVFGMVSPPPTGGHENIQVADVETEKKIAREQQVAIDHLRSEMTPAQIVHAYCRATEDERRLVNLSSLSVEQQDWLLRLSDAELVMLGESGEGACSRSIEALKLMVSRSKLRAPEIETPPLVLPIPKNMPMTREQKQQFVEDRFDELFPGIRMARMDPKCRPAGSAAIH